jgi:hypothetical protein
LVQHPRCIADDRDEIIGEDLVSVIGYAPWVLYQLSRGSIGWTATGVGFVLLSGPWMNDAPTISNSDENAMNPHFLGTR